MSDDGSLHDGSESGGTADLGSLGESSMNMDERASQGTQMS
jgi:hypothetical protein